MIVWAYKRASTLPYGTHALLAHAMSRGTCLSGNFSYALWTALLFLFFFIGRYYNFCERYIHIGYRQLATTQLAQVAGT